MADDAQSLSEVFRRLIRNTGPISLSQFMGEANAHYYAGKDPLGAGGDFVTAPEISQMFGELIGLWMADVWIRNGQSGLVHYVELGPGRGTLAKDALRSARQYGFEPRVHFVETSPALREAQLKNLPGAIWHDDLTTLPGDGAIIMVANEFLDALPIRQLVHTPDGWRERMIGLENDEFVFVAGQQDMGAALPPEFKAAQQGAIVETCPAAAAIMREVAHRLADQGGAALFIDYGYCSPQTGSTFQAVKDHQKVNPLQAPGEADLTAHVDFSVLSKIAESHGLRHSGTVSQGAWLRALGIDMRAQSLARNAPQHAQAIETAKDRLIAADQMGQLFKVMGLTSVRWPDGAGFVDA